MSGYLCVGHYHSFSVDLSLTKGRPCTINNQRYTDNCEARVRKVIDYLTESPFNVPKIMNT